MGADRKWRCRECGRSFWQRFPGILPRKRATEPFRRSVALKHWDGISRRRLGQREAIGSATVERWFEDFLRLRAAERHNAPLSTSARHRRALLLPPARICHHLVRPKGHKVFDVVLNRSEAALESYLEKLPGKKRVRVVCMDLASAYRSLVRHNLKPEQVAKLEAYLARYPVLRQIYRLRVKIMCS